MNGDVFTEEYFYSSSVECGGKFAPKHVYDDVVTSSLIAGARYTYCVRAISSISFYGQPYISLPTCVNHTVLWESAVRGSVLLSEKGGSKPVPGKRLDFLFVRILH